jgi:hypothetical protein
MNSGEIDSVIRNRFTLVDSGELLCELYNEEEHEKHPDQMLL